MSAPSDSPIPPGLADALAASPEVRLAVLFGSRARGEARADSDVDLAVLGATDPVALADRLGQACGLEVDIVRLERDLPVPLLRSILRDAVIVFARAGEAARWVVRAQTLLALVGPRHRDAARRFLERLAARGR